MIIETERLRIRNFVPDDAGALRDLIMRKEASEYAVYDHEWPTSIGAIKGIADWFAQADHYLAVCLQDDDRLIGFISLNPDEEGRERQLDLGYCFHPDFQRQGYATEGCRAVLCWAFTQLRARRVTSGTAAANLPSCRLLERLGFRQVGEDTASFRQTPEGQPIEFRALSFALTREEWGAGPTFPFRVTDRRRHRS